ncbi:Pr6Pr family membrane protein [Streptococcus infantis]|uniref:Pr6Pr family membrane protein n=1 Tax=Streptococcus TaxID=1301 RepID=UPI00066BB877|nr:Pr6Pr family membrane protein [Streptococcus pseudopneumoniae]
MTVWNKIIFFSRAFMFLAAFTGVYLEITKRGGLRMLLYYTVLSNLLVVIFTGYLLLKMRREGDHWQSSSLLRLKGGVTMSIMITCVIYHFMLAPLTTDFYRLENFLCHYIVPLWFLVDTIIFDKSRQYKWFDPIVWTVLPLLYMGFAILNGFVLKMDVPNAKDSPFPYFFLNANKYGWGFVFRWAAIIFVAYMVSGYLFYLVKNIKKSKK